MRIWTYTKWNMRTINVIIIKGLLTESEVCNGKVFAWGFRTDRATKERGLCG